MNTSIEKFHIAGISVRTSNEPGKGEKDIPQLWERFVKENISSLITNKINNDIYAVYTDYVGDHTQPYTIIIGHRVSGLDNIPAGINGVTIESGNYEKFTATGKMEDNVVFLKWLEIWKQNLNRKYITDFEVYKEGCFQQAEASDNISVDIFIGINR